MSISGFSSFQEAEMLSVASLMCKRDYEGWEEKSYRRSQYGGQSVVEGTLQAHWGSVRHGFLYRLL